MGRPPLKDDVEQTKTTMIRLTAEMRDRIEAASPKRMAEFIRNAIEEKLQQIEQSKKADRAP